VGEAGDGSSHTHLSAYDVTKTYMVGDDYQRHRWQCTTSLVSLRKLYRKSKLDSVLHSYNLAGVIKFPTGIAMNSHTTTDNVFVDTSTIGKYDLYPLINGLSDHDAQLLLILNKGKEKEHHTYIKRKINKYTITDFRLK